MNSTIYILNLEQNKYYVGRTDNIDKRISDHFTNVGSVWTQKYKPISVRSKIASTNKFDELKYTLEMMDKYGVENVRGAQYSQVHLSESQINEINLAINSANDRCHKCGERGHFVKDCKITINIPLDTFKVHPLATLVRNHISIDEHDFMDEHLYNIHILDEGRLFKKHINRIFTYMRNGTSNCMAQTNQFILHCDYCKDGCDSCEFVMKLKINNNGGIDYIKQYICKLCKRICHEDPDKTCGYIYKWTDHNMYQKKCYYQRIGCSTDLFRYYRTGEYHCKYHIQNSNLNDAKRILKKLKISIVDTGIIGKDKNIQILFSTDDAYLITDATKKEMTCGSICLFCKKMSTNKICTNCQSTPLSGCAGSVGDTKQYKILSLWDEKIL